MSMELTTKVKVLQAFVAQEYDNVYVWAPEDDTDFLYVYWESTSGEKYTGTMSFFWSVEECIEELEALADINSFRKTKILYYGRNIALQKSQDVYDTIGDKIATKIFLRIEKNPASHRYVVAYTIPYDSCNVRHMSTSMSVNEMVKEILTNIDRIIAI